METQKDPRVDPTTDPGMDEVFRALADPSRRRLLDSLNVRSGQTLRELCVGLDMARQSVSKHLAVLEAANLVTTVRRGREKLHYLNAAPINDIADRWIDHYHRGRVHALADLKRALEDPAVQKPAFVYTTYIRTTPERLWRGLTDPAFTRRYWSTAIESDWNVGSTMTWIQADGVAVVDPEQRVLEYEPYRRLAYTWHTFTPEWAAAVGIPEDVRAVIAAERRSKVAFEIEPVGDMLKLTVVHDGFDDDSTVAEMVSQGWPAVVARLKTLLENDGFATEIVVAAPREQVYDALTTLDGLAGWWVPDASGSPEPGGELTFRFGDQAIVMRVDRADRPEAVAWTCISHTKFPDWNGTTLTFELRARDEASTIVAFRHAGLVPDLDCYTTCARGWNHYLASLTGYVEGKGGSPYGSEEWERGRTARVG
jgi:uncharacterized protein YndB with AHSA1/START domain/DNA-binding transcriptional ArsR family regulator